MVKFGPIGGRRWEVLTKLAWEPLIRPSGTFSPRGEERNANFNREKLNRSVQPTS